MAVEKLFSTITGVDNKGHVSKLRFINILKLTEQRQRARSRQKQHEKRYGMFA